MLKRISLSRMAHGQPSIKKAIGVLKDSTTVGLAKVNNDKKEIDVAIVKATNHENVLPKEKHIRTIFAALSSRTSHDVAYCIHGLAKRLSKTHSWAVALKTLIVLHRATREVDFSFCEEFINYTRNKSIMHRLSRFTDDSSENAWSYSAWVRTYALYLEERLECIHILNYDVETNSPRAQDLDAPDLFDQLPALQQLLSRLLACQPEGAAKQNSLIKYALTIVTNESVRLYVVITDGVLAFVDKFYEMHRHDAYKALDIYRTAGNQAERLSEFYEMYKNLGLGQGEKLIKVEPPPSSFLTALENYVKESPQPLGLLRSSGSNKVSKDGLSKGMDEGGQKEKMNAPGSKDGSIEKPKVIGAVEKLTLSDAKGEIMQDRY